MSPDALEALNLLRDIYFDYDRADIRSDARLQLARNADALRRFDFLRVTIEGHCDERGSVEYNLALGERRAKAAYEYLVSLGVASERLSVVSYGKETPLCVEESEACWANNRRAKSRVTAVAARE